MQFLRTESRVFVLDPFEVPTVKPSPVVSHHVIVIDRSGSMYSDIDPLKKALEQALAVEASTNGNVLTTLISFSSQGDVTLHWAKKTVSEVFELKNPYLNILRSIRATYLTGMSQALELALKNVDAKQTTAITLFTDGYANDPSAYQEVKNLDAFVAKAKGFPALFLNCIGYRDWCDWPRLNQMSNTLSGKTVKAKSFKDVLDAMTDTQKLLSGSVCPTVTVTSTGIVVAINRTLGQVNAAEGELSLRGVNPEDDLRIFQVREADDPPRGAKAVPKEEAYLYGALALAYMSLSDMRTAKELLFASGNKTLWSEHQTAATPSSIAEMINDLNDWVRVGVNDAYTMGKNTKPKFSIFDLASVLDSLPENSVGLAADEFYQGYRRRSVKAIPGTRGEDGAIIPPNAFLKPSGRTYIRGVAFNSNDASVQLETVAPATLYDSQGNEVKEVAYVPLRDLKEYRTFTLVSSGELNVERVPLEVYSKEAWSKLTPFLTPAEAKAFKPGKKVRIPIKKFKMEAEQVPTVLQLQNVVRNRLEMEAELKLLSGLASGDEVKAEASPFTPEQLTELKKFHLSAKLYFTPPSTVPYLDKKEAVAKGEIDSYTAYKVNFSTLSVSKSDFRSGNEFLRRRYVVKDKNKTEVEKPTLDGYLRGDTYEVKPPNPKSKDTEADAMMARIFDAVLLGGVRLDAKQIHARLVAMKAGARNLDDDLRPLVMQIGCTGLLPRELEKGMTRYEPEAYEQKFGVKLGKNEKEGIYYVSGDLVISITPETKWYSTGTGEA